MTQPLVLIAASGLAREVLATVGDAGSHHAVAILDDSQALHGARIGGIEVAGGTDLAAQFGDAQFVVCAGAGSARRRIVDRLAAQGIGPTRFAAVVHPSAVVPASCVIGAGSVVLAHVTLTANVSIGCHVVVMPHVVLTHDNQIDEFATICAGVVLGGSVRVGASAYLGMNAAVRQDLRVGQASTLGMGSVLLSDLPDGQTWAGVPAIELVTRSGTADAAQHHQQEGPSRSSDVNAMERTEAR